MKLLFVDQMFPSDVDKVLFLDADQLYKQDFDISKLFHINMYRYAIALQEHAGYLDKYD
jgi:lipopolysaccharide biosynthesis glycosyltransferase